MQKVLLHSKVSFLCRYEILSFYNVKTKYRNRNFSVDITNYMEFALHQNNCYIEYYDRYTQVTVLDETFTRFPEMMMLLWLCKIHKGNIY